MYRTIDPPHRPLDAPRQVRLHAARQQKASRSVPALTVLVDVEMALASLVSPPNAVTRVCGIRCPDCYCACASKVRHLSSLIPYTLMALQ